MTVILVAGLVVVVLVHLSDAAAIEYVRGTHNPLVRFMARITNVGLSQWYLVPSALVFLAIAFIDWSSRTRSSRARLALFFGQAGYAFLAIAVAGLINNLIKYVVGRARPKLFEQMGTLSFEPFKGGYLHTSFPSGHSTTLGALAVVLMLWFPRLRWPILIVCLWAAATRVAASAHYPSDVVAGFLLGFLYALFLARWLAARGTVFRSVGSLFPVARFRSARQSKTPPGR